MRIDPASAPLTPDDHAILAGVAGTIRNGEELKRWFRSNLRTRIPLASFPLARQIHEPDSNYGFLLDANLDSGQLPVAGVVQDQLFAWPKSPGGAPSDPANLRAFILEHFMRMAATQPPLRPGAERNRTGWAYNQVYYQLTTGETGKFPESQQTQMMPLYDVGRKYNWVVFRVNIYHLNSPLHLTDSPNGPMLNASLLEPVYTVMTPDYLLDETRPEPGVLGRYGYGYSVLADPTKTPLLAASPSALTYTIETLAFTLLDTGEIRAHMDFIMPQPPRILNFDPVGWSFAAADKLSFGTASKILAPVKEILRGFEPQVDPLFLFLRLLNQTTIGLSGDEFDYTRERLLDRKSVV